jgi:hypothetical protein
MLLIHITDRFCSCRVSITVFVLSILWSVQWHILLPRASPRMELVLFLVYSLHFYISRELPHYFPFFTLLESRCYILLLFVPRYQNREANISISISAFHVHRCAPWLLASLQEPHARCGTICLHAARRWDGSLFITFVS